MVVQKAWIVVVVNEETQSVNIREIIFFFLVTGFDIAHPLLVAEDIVDSVVHRVVKQCGDCSLVASYVSRVPVENLAHLEDTS